MENKYKMLQAKKTPGQTFNKDEIFIIKAGKKINMYQMIQEAREDTEIYPTIEKYGTIEKLKLNTEEVYADVSNAMNLRNALDKSREIENVWYNLPLETRQEFNHSPKEFAERGYDWLNKKIEANKPKPEIKQPEIKQPEIKQPKTGAENNG